MKISYGQLWAIFFLYKVSALICSNGAYSVNQMIGTGISTALQFMILLPVFIIIKKKKYGLNFSVWNNALFTCCFIFSGMFSVSGFMSVLTNENPKMSFLSYVIIVAVLAVCAVYCSSLGIHATGRSAVIVAGIFVFFMAVLFVTSYTEAEFSNFTLSYDKNSILYYVFEDISYSIELPSLLLLPYFTEKSGEKSLLLYFGSKLFISLAVSFIGIIVLGGTSVISLQPFLEICSFSQPLSVQRSDALFIGIYTLVTVVNITVDIIAVREFSKAYVAVNSVVTAALIASGGIFLYMSEIYKPGYLAILIFTVLVYISVLRRRKEKTGVCRV